jgi:TetR/AcrR family transcriptional repressor of nem operon
LTDRSNPGRVPSLASPRATPAEARHALGKAVRRRRGPDQGHAGLLGARLRGDLDAGPGLLHGHNRGSLYATFGDKRSLFIQALRRYDAVHRQAWVAALGETASPRRAILTAFEAVIAKVLKAGARDGCLLVNTALELSPHDPEISEIVRAGLAEMEGFFRRMIENGQAAGEIPTDLDAVETSRALLGLFIGLRVLSRSRPERALLRAIARQAEALLE